MLYIVNLGKEYDMKFAVVLILSVVMLMLVSAVFAQEPAVPPVPSPNEAFDSLVGYILATLLSTVAQSPIVSSLVAIVKRFDFARGVPASVVNLIVTVVVTVVVWLATSLGFVGQLDTLFKLIISVSGVLIGASSSSLWYSTVVRGVPFLGTSRVVNVVANDR